MSTKRNEIYHCELCGSMLTVLETGSVPVCCGKKMEALTENTKDASVEKHIPSVEKTATGYKVTVGSVVHPMEDTHFIQFIQLLVGDAVQPVFLTSKDAHVATFAVESTNEPIVVREFCNIHGLWKTSV